MKKYIWILAILMFFTFTLSGCAGTDNTDNKSRAISEKVRLEIVDEDGKVWLDNSDLNKTKLATDDEGREYIEFTTTKQGETKLFNATTENDGRYLDFMVDGSVKMSLRVVAPIENGVFCVNGLEKDELKELFNMITDAQ